MKLNSKGFAITSIVYSMLILFLTLVVLIIGNLASRKAVFDQQKKDILDNVDIPQEELATICTYQGTDESKKYEYGAKYTCDPGDGTPRTFYLLEDGATTTLAKSDGSPHLDSDNVGTTNKGEVSLIMNQNIGETLGWCLSGNNDSSCNASGVRAYLEEQKINNGWTARMTLPTYAQVYQASGNKTENIPSWLWENLWDEESAPTLPFGYWTSTAYNSYDSGGAKIINSNGEIRQETIQQTLFGVRPVIIVFRGQLD